MNKKTSSKNRSPKRTITLQAGKNIRNERALEAMEHSISRRDITFNEVAANIREHFIHEYLPFYFSQVDPCDENLRLSALRTISFYEGKVKFFQMLISGGEKGGVGDDEKGGIRDDAGEDVNAHRSIDPATEVVNKGSFEEYKGYHDESFDGSDDPISDRFSLPIFETSDSGSG